MGKNELNQCLKLPRLKVWPCEEALIKEETNPAAFLVHQVPVFGKYVISVSFSIAGSHGGHFLLINIR